MLKRQSLIKISKRGIERLGPSVINLSKYKNLDVNTNSIKKSEIGGKIIG